ncbi:prepilin-type cleavage/methylation protein [Haloferula helveola]|uniref:Prepilin-type cleavage/methylation protein n=1 Tax=Haloferula helveola TaxID=490095 RepID=A0ABM7RID5_9BACT|nr:prepilin-type cleavage/methylation protein [Haloferula helveola]
MKTHFSNRRSSGFTLIELMVAMGITAIIITVLVTITGVATDTWTRSRSEIRASRQAKTMLDTMAKDFESLVSRRGNNFEWLHAAIVQGGNLPKVAKNQGSAADAVGVTFLTAATDRYLGQVGDPNVDKGGDVSCVSYRLRFKDPIDGGNNKRTSTFVLYRLLVNPDDTFKDLLGKDDLEDAFSSYETNVDDEENFICENVHQFTITFHVEISKSSGSSGASVPETVRVTLSSDQSQGEFSLTGSGIDSNISVSGVTTDELKAGRLKAVEISMSVVSDAGIIRMNASGQGLSEDDYARNVYHYSRMVELPGM